MKTMKAPALSNVSWTNLVRAAAFTWVAAYAAFVYVPDVYVLVSLWPERFVNLSD